MGIVLSSLLVHAWHVGSAWERVERSRGARDFATYWHAAGVAGRGGDPYDVRQLRASGRQERVRGGVHPFFYPPPFVVAMGPLASMELNRAYRLWFWICELALLSTVLVLALWWAPLHRLAPAVLALVAAAMTAFPNNLVMGQANLPVLLLVVLGLVGMARRRPALSGVLVGGAAMLKMSPALFVLGWAARGQWRAVAAAVLTAVLLTLGSLAWVGPAVQWEFYVEILPSSRRGSTTD